MPLHEDDGRVAANWKLHTFRFVRCGAGQQRLQSSREVETRIAVAVRLWN